MVIYFLLTDLILFFYLQMLESKVVILYDPISNRICVSKERIVSTAKKGRVDINAELKEGRIRRRKRSALCTRCDTLCQNGHSCGIYEWRAVVYLLYARGTICFSLEGSTR